MPDLDFDAMELLRCPVTHSAIHRGSTPLLTALNEAIASKTLTNRCGQTIAAPMDSVLVNESGEIALSVRDGIVQLIADEAINIPEALRS